MPTSWRGGPSQLLEPRAGVHLPHGLTLEEAARRYVEAAIDRAGGNKTEAARTLDIGRNRITRLLKR